MIWFSSCCSPNVLARASRQIARASGLWSRSCAGGANFPRPTSAIPPAASAAVPWKLYKVAVPLHCSVHVARSASAGMWHATAIAPVGAKTIRLDLSELRPLHYYHTSFAVMVQYLYNFNTTSACVSRCEPQHGWKKRNSRMAVPPSNPQQNYRSAHFPLKPSVRACGV